jgi:hypothetical protein
MIACSFSGNWIGGEIVVLILAAGAAMLLTPILLGGVVGWSLGRKRGRPWRGALKGAAWVCGAYALLGIAWWATQFLHQRSAHAEMAAMQALIEPVRDVRPGGWGAQLEALDLLAQPRPRRQPLAWEVLNQASLPEPWTATDLQALDALAQKLASDDLDLTGAALAGIVAFHRDGEAGIERVRAACAPAPACGAAIDEALNRHDYALVAHAQQAQALWQAEPLATATSAALERLLLRQRAYAADWGNRGDARLAFDRVRRGALSAALEACGGELTASTLPSGDVSYCWSELLVGLENHAPARLCPARNGVDQADRGTLHAWRAAWVNDSDHTRRLGILIDGLEAACGG